MSGPNSFDRDLAHRLSQKIVDEEIRRMEEELATEWGWTVEQVREECLRLELEAKIHRIKELQDELDRRN